MRLRYRGSVLGPFWQTITTIVMISSMGFIFARLFRTQLQDYLPMLTVGLIFWQFIAGMITEGCATFSSVQSIIQQVKLPFSLHAYRLVYRNVLVLLHSFVIVPIVLVLFPHPVVGLRLLEARPGAGTDRAQRGLGEPPARDDQCALPRRAADRRQRRPSRVLHHADFLARRRAWRAPLAGGGQSAICGNRRDARAAARPANRALFLVDPCGVHCIRLCREFCVFCPVPRAHRILG